MSLHMCNVSLFHFFCGISVCENTVYFCIYVCFLPFFVFFFCLCLFVCPVLVYLLLLYLLLLFFKIPAVFWTNRVNLHVWECGMDLGGVGMEKIIIRIHCMRKVYFQLKKLMDSFVSKKQRDAKHPSLNSFG